MLSPLLDVANTCGNAVGSTDRRDPGDGAYLMSMAIVIVSMQGGFALLEAGGVRHTNSVNIMMKNITDMCVGSLVFWLCGWAFAYGTGPGANSFWGFGSFASVGVDDTVNWFFQFSFAATASTIDSGAVAERMQFLPYVALSTFMTAWTYPIVAHWVWGGGFLYQWGFVDFAGSGVVHLTGGCSALVAAWWIGPRTGRYTNSKHTDPRVRQLRVATGMDPDHEESFQANDPNQQLFGTFLLWLGWYGFNCGSTLAVSNNGDVNAGHVAMTTTVAAGAGGLSGMIMSYRRGGYVAVADTSNGILGGLVAVTAMAHVVEPWHAFIVGMTVAPLVELAVKFFDYLHIDDPVSAISIHGVGGFYGIIMTSFFATNTRCGVPIEDEGVFYGGSYHLIWVQCAGAGLIMAWAMVNTLLFLGACQYIFKVGLRVSLVDEMRGLDLAEHGVDQGEHMLQYIRNMYLTMATLDPSERMMIRKIMIGFVQPEKHWKKKSVFVSPEAGGFVVQDDEEKDTQDQDDDQDKDQDSNKVKKARKFSLAADSASVADLLEEAAEQEDTAPGPADYIRHQSLADMYVLAKATAADTRLPERMRARARKSTRNLQESLMQSQAKIAKAVAARAMLPSSSSITGAGVDAGATAGDVSRLGPANPNASLLTARAYASQDTLAAVPDRTEAGAAAGNTLRTLLTSENLTITTQPPMMPPTTASTSHGNGNGNGNGNERARNYEMELPGIVNDQES